MCMITSLVVLAIGQASALPVSDDDGFPTLSIIPATREIVPFEPLLVLVVFKNEGRAAVRLDLNDLNQLLFLRTDGPALRPCGTCPEFGVKSTTLGEWQLPPGKRVSRVFWLFRTDPDMLKSLFERKVGASRQKRYLYAFAEPSKCVLIARTRLLQSAPVTMTVKDPSAEELAAAEVFTQLRFARWLEYGTPRSNAEEGEKTCDEVRVLLGKGLPRAFADYANYRVGLDVLNGRRGTPEILKHGCASLAAVSNRVRGLRVRAAAYEARYPPLSEEQYAALNKEIAEYTAEDCLWEDPAWPVDMARRLMRAKAIRFEKDDRLERKVKLHFAERVPENDVLREVSQQTGVVLKIEPERNGALVTLTVPPDTYGTLREFMTKRANSREYWEKRADDYCLVADERPTTIRPPDW
jgi:hypothetical protein